MTDPAVPPLPEGLRFMSETTTDECAGAAALLRRASDELDVSLRVMSPDIAGSRFQRLGMEIEHRITPEGSAVVSASFAKGGDERSWDSAIVVMRAIGLGTFRHPLSPGKRGDIASREAAEKEMTLLRHAIAHAATLLDIAADGERDMTPGLVRDLRARMLGVAATMVQEAETAGRGSVDTVWSSHDGPLRVLAYDADGGAEDLLDETRRAAWSAGLPPVMGIAKKGNQIVLRPMLIDASLVPADTLARLRMASALSGL